MDAPDVALTEKPATLDVRRATVADAEAWDAYVRAHPEGNFFQLSGWPRVINAVYGYADLSLVATEGERVVGVLPLIDVKSPLFGRSIISTAFTVGGGILADDEVVRAALALRAAILGEERKVQYVELRGEGPELPSWRGKSNVYAAFRKELPADEDENLQMIPRKKRADVRKGIKALETGALTVTHGDDIDAFYKLYAQSLRNLGTPVFAKKLVKALMAEFHDAVEITVVHSRSQPVAAVLSFYFRDAVLPYYGGAGEEARGLHAYDLMYWSLMRRAVERGARVFDFGRSKFNTGAFAYKTYWGFEATALRYQYKLIATSELPNVNPNNPKFSRMTQVWRRLPLPLANFVGPIVARNLG